MFLSNFAERLSELVYEKGKNAEKVGKDIGCGNATLYHYLNGSRLPSVEMAVKLADYFKCTVDFLLGLCEENEAEAFKACPPFCERLPALCKECNITRYGIRKKTDISESCLRYWAQGKTTPTILNIVKIARALEVSVDYVLGREI